MSPEEFLKAFNEKKKELSKDPTFKKARQAEYTRNWKKRVKEQRNSDPDFIADRLRIETEREERRKQNEVRLEYLRKRREDKREARKARLEKEERDAKEFDYVYLPCFDLFSLKDKLKKVKFVKRFGRKEEFVGLLFVVFFTTPDNKTNKITKPIRFVEGVDKDFSIKFGITSLFAEISDMYEVAEIVEEEQNEELITEEIENEEDDIDYDDFDMGF